MQSGIFSLTPALEWIDGRMWICMPGPGRHLYIEKAVTAEQVEEPLRILAASIRPAPREAVIKALGEVALLTKLKNMEQVELTGTISVFAARLSELPGDAVLHTLRGWPERNRFFPSYAELTEAVRVHSWRACAIDRLTSLRKALP